MDTLDSLTILFIIWAFLFQIVLIVHFALRKWFFFTALRYGWIVYALGIPAFMLSLLLLLAGKVWWLWLGGILCLIWAVFGYTVEYVRKIEWRNAVRWPILGPYILLYLATLIFYWWPVGILVRPLWYVYAVLFIISTVLNVTSHKAPGEIKQAV